MFDLVIFDLDGVLVDSEGLASEVVAEELSARGCPISAQEVAERFAGFTDSALARVLGEERGIDIGNDFPARVAERAIARIKAGELPAMPGARAVVERLAPWRRCVASNSAPARIKAALTATGLLQWFPAGWRFSAREVKRPKPAPDLHLLAAKRMRVEPARAVVVEDSPTGVEAAVAAGMTVIGFTGASHVPPGPAERLRALGAVQVIEELERLPEALGVLER